MSIIKHKRGTSDPSTSDVAVGELAINTTDGGLFTQTDGGSVVEIGSGGGLSSDSNGNTLGGTNAGDAITTAANNVILGLDAGTDITSAGQCVFIGAESGKTVTINSANVGVGYRTLKSLNNTANEYVSRRNVAIGDQCLKSQTTADENVGVGGETLESITTGSKNTAIGSSAGNFMTTGNRNVFLGHNAAGTYGFNGSYNVCIGAQAALSQGLTGNNNILIGYQSVASATTISNEITLGNADITKFRIPGLDSFQIDDNGTIDLPGAIDENVVAITDGASVDLDPDNGTLQTWTLGANRTATESLTTGQSMLLVVTAGSYTLTFPTITWVGGSAPTLSTSKPTAIEIWKIGSTLYGANVGDLG